MRGPINTREKRKKPKTSKVNIRCYIEKEDFDYSQDKNRRNSVNPSESIVLVFDTETTNDEYQNLVFGSCGIWVNGILDRFCLFYADDLDAKRVDILKEYGKKKGYEVLSREKFVDEIFVLYVLIRRAKCVAFNMPFDVSRIALKVGKPRINKYTRIYENGFTFPITDKTGIPYVRIKSINSKASFIGFTGRSFGKKGSKREGVQYKGYFLDLKTFSYVLTSESHTLKSALEAFGCSPKTDAGEHGKITEEYIEYNVNDTMVTHELYEKLMERYEQYIPSKDANKLYSPASIGKAYLDRIGIKSFFEKNRNFSREILGYIMMTYYGGRTEVKIRKQPVRASYIDFTSMYPSVFALFGMNDFLISRKIVPKYNTEEVQEFLDNVTLEDIGDKSLWKKMTTICRIIPDNDILPVRSTYQQDVSGTNIGINHLKSIDRTSLWYTLPDLVAAKMLSKNNKAPKIEEAITFVPSGVQKGLQPIEILKGIELEPGEDFIKKLIEERIRIRTDIKERRNNKPDYKGSEEESTANVRQKILKIIANATSYGIFIQMNTTNENEELNEKAGIYGLDYFETEINREETPGEFFNPIMSVFLTAGSRLILAASEALAIRSDGHIAYCDTDAVFVSPRQVKEIQGFFKALNPYDAKEDLDMFKIEDDGKGNLMDDKWFYGISAKRYVLYDYKDKDEFEIYKYSAHAMGHLEGIDEKRWWYNILRLEYNPNEKQVILADYDGDYVISQISVSTYNMFERFKVLNESKKYKKMIKPFNFATIGTGYRFDEKKQPIIPFLPYASPEKRGQVPFMPFVDYKTGRLYSGNIENGQHGTEYYWKPLAEFFENYVDHPEAKFDGNIGELKRKHLKISSDSIVYVGKETNALERSKITGEFDEDQTKYADYVKILQSIKPTRDYKKVGLSRRRIIELQKECRNGKHDFKENVKEKLRKFQDLVFLRDEDKTKMTFF